MKRRRWYILRNFIETIGIALIIAMTLRLFVVSAYKIPTGAMLPTLETGDFVLVWKLPFGLEIPYAEKKLFEGRLPDRGDVVAFRYPHKSPLSFVKRVVGLPGDRVFVQDRRLYVNDVPASYKKVEEGVSRLEGAEFYRMLEEDILGSRRAVMVRRGDVSRKFGPVVVPPGHIFVMGDNRDSSDDSRYWGPVPVADIEGRVQVIWMSLDWIPGNAVPSVRWDRMFQAVR